jgi:ferritin
MGGDAMIKDNVRDAINTQMNREFYSSFLYLSMAGYFESMNLKGFSAWMQVQAKEEHAHGMKFFDYLVDQGARISMAAIEAPAGEWATPLGAFEHVLGHEQKVTGLIHDLMELAMSEMDHATATMLQWFVTEQVEEEAHASEIVFKMKLASAEKGAVLLYLLDHELGKRGKNP